MVNLLRDIFPYVDVQIVAHSFKENGVQAMSAEGDAEFYADEEIEQYSGKFLLENRELRTNFTKDSKSCELTRAIPSSSQESHNNQLFDNYLQYHPNELSNYVKEFDFQYSDNTDEESILLFVMLVDARDVYSQYKFDVDKTRQKFHVTLKLNVELKRQPPSKFPSHLK